MKKQCNITLFCRLLDDDIIDLWGHLNIKMVSYKMEIPDIKIPVEITIVLKQCPLGCLNMNGSFYQYDKNSHCKYKTTSLPYT